MMAFDDDTKMCAGCSWKPHGISWPNPNDYDYDDLETKLPVLMMTNNFQKLFIPQTALGNHMESLGRTLMEKVAEVSGNYRNGKMLG